MRNDLHTTYYLLVYLFQKLRYLIREKLNILIALLYVDRVWKK